MAGVRVAAAIVTCAVIVAGPASRADAGQRIVVRRVCRAPARVFDTPGGIVVGILARRQQVRVLRHSVDDRHWLRVTATLGISGWMSDRALCP
jgi:hypothetical protein